MLCEVICPKPSAIKLIDDAKSEEAEMAEKELKMIQNGDRDKDQEKHWNKAAARQVYISFPANIAKARCPTPKLLPHRNFFFFHPFVPGVPPEQPSQARILSRMWIDR